MNLPQLMATIPAERHSSVHIVGSFVYAIQADGSLMQYIMSEPNQDLTEVPTAKAVSGDLTTLKTALADAQAAIIKLQTDLTALKVSVAKISTKVGA